MPFKRPLVQFMYSAMNQQEIESETGTRVNVCAGSDLPDREVVNRT